jgi:hypothetical protein
MHEDRSLARDGDFMYLGFALFGLPQALYATHIEWIYLAGTANPTLRGQNSSIKE